MRMHSRLIGAWVAFVAASVAVQVNRELSAAPAPPIPCNQCTCKVAPYWALGNQYFGLRKDNGDGTTSPVNNMYQYPRNLGQNVNSWSANCDAGSPTYSGSYPGYTYGDATPDCTYGGSGGALVACTAATGYVWIGNNVAQLLCQ